MIMPCISICSCSGIIWMICALALSTLIAPYDETMRVFHLLHLLIEVDFPPFVDDFHLETKVTLDQKTFISILAHSPHFSFGGPSSMVYELLQNYFVPNDYTSGFDFFFEVCGHIVQGHVPLLILQLLSTSRFLALEKKSRSIHPIAINEVTYRLVTHTLSIQFKYTLVEHFSPH